MFICQSKWRQFLGYFSHEELVHHFVFLRKPLLLVESLSMSDVWLSPHRVNWCVPRLPGLNVVCESLVTIMWDSNEKLISNAIFIFVCISRSNRSTSKFLFYRYTFNVSLLILFQRFQIGFWFNLELSKLFFIFC